MSLGTLSAALVQPVWAALPTAARGEFLGKCDLSQATLEDPDARVTPAQFCVAWVELIRATRNPAIALRMAESTPVGAFGVIEYLCRSQSNFGDAVRQWVRYLNLLDDAVVVGIVTERGTTCLRVLSESEAPAPASHEFCFAMIMNRARSAARDPVVPLAIHFGHRPAIDEAVYADWFGAPVTFGAEHTQMVFAPETLGIALTTADPSLSKALERFADDRQTELQSHVGLLAETRRHIRAGLQVDDANIESVARRAGMTPRSLQRRLKDEGTSFSQLRESVRRDLADHYIREDLTIAEISFLLGFSEPSAFFRAFKRWTGLTPLDARARARAG